MGVGAAGIGHEIDPARPEKQILKAELDLAHPSREEPMNGAETRDAVKAGDTGLMAFELGQEMAHGRREFRWREVARLRSGTLHQIGEPDAMIEQGSVMLGAQPLD